MERDTLNTSNVARDNVCGRRTAGTWGAGLMLDFMSVATLSASLRISFGFLYVTQVKAMNLITLFIKVVMR